MSEPLTPERLAKIKADAAHEIAESAHFQKRHGSDPNARDLLSADPGEGSDGAREAAVAIRARGGQFADLNALLVKIEEQVE
jgi:hypothetical protein